MEKTDRRKLHEALDALVELIENEADRTNSSRIISRGLTFGARFSIDASLSNEPIDGYLLQELKIVREPDE